MLYSANVPGGFRCAGLFSRTKRNRNTKRAGVQTRCAPMGGHARLAGGFREVQETPGRTRSGGATQNIMYAPTRQASAQGRSVGRPG